nr:hypothetical protein [Tanacetum cinerariifolium]
MLHICPMIPGQSFDELPFEEEILEFLRFLRHSAQIRTLTDVNINKLFQPWRSFGAVINKCLTGKSSAFDSFREAAPKPKASARRKRSGSDTSITPPTIITTPISTGSVTPRLTAAVKGKQPAKAKSPSDPLEETESDEESDGDETREEESFDPILKTLEDSEDDGNGKEDQGLRISEEERTHEEEEADELYRDVDINQGRGLQLSQDVKDSQVTLTPVHPDGQQESLSVWSQFVTSMLNPTSDAADLSEMELKKIFIEKMEGNKSIQRSDEQTKPL